MAPRSSAVAATPRTNGNGKGQVQADLRPVPTRGRKGVVDLGNSVPYEKPTQLTIPAPNLHVIQVEIVGNAPYVQNKFAAKAALMAAQSEGSTAKNRGKKRDPKDFEKLFKAAQHIAVDGWHGMPAAGFRNAMIRACSLVGYKMTEAKMSVFVLGDGFDEEGTPLVRMVGTPKRIESHVRNATGVIDIRSRPMWQKWSARPKIQYDADQFREIDVINLLARAGAQVGVGEGRPFSKDSCGMGWGTFDVPSLKRTN